VRGKTCKEMLIRFGLKGATEIIEYIFGEVIFVEEGALL
jgi:hypothetical protein